MTEDGHVWYYRQRPHYPIEGVQLTNAVIVWPREGRSCPPMFVLRGKFSLPGVDRKTRPAEALVTLSLPVAGDQLAERVIGEEIVLFQPYRRLWLYRMWHERR